MVNTGGGSVSGTESGNRARARRLPSSTERGPIAGFRRQTCVTLRWRFIVGVALIERRRRTWANCLLRNRVPTPCRQMRDAPSRFGDLVIRRATVAQNGEDTLDVGPAGEVGRAQDS